MSRPDDAAVRAARSEHGGPDYPRLEREAIQALAREEEAEALARTRAGLDAEIRAATAAKPTQRRFAI